MFFPAAFRVYAGGHPSPTQASLAAAADALKTLDIPIVECHLSNPAAREDFRRSSYVSLAATGVVSGFGAASYELAIDAACDLTAAPRV